MTSRAKTVTILFTDLVSSTELLLRAGDDDAQRIFQAHHRLLSDVLRRHGGHEVKWLGDGLMVAFDSVLAAVRCAVEMQQESRRPTAGERLQIRVGLNLGEALRDESDYFGSSVVAARRLCDSGDGGEIRVSDLVVQLLSERDEFSFDDLGELALKGLTKPVHAWRVAYLHDPLAMLAQTPFVGRGAELAALARELEEARGARGRVAMLVGEPGIGKTRTCEEFAAHAKSAGFAVLIGHCYEGKWAPPLSPFAEMIRTYAALVTVDELRTDLAYDGPLLARLIPGLREALPEIPDLSNVEARGERTRLIEAIGRWLERAASRFPLLLLLDDLHWADEGTLAVLRHVGHEISSLPVLVVGTYRDIEVGSEHPLTEAVADLRRRGRMVRIAISGLQVEEVGSLLGAVSGDDVSPEAAQIVTSETAGNPLFIREVLLNLVEGRLERPTAGGWLAQLNAGGAGTTEGIREVIDRRVSRLSADAARALMCVCPMTAGFELDVLMALTGFSEERTLDIIDESVAARLLVEMPRDEGISYIFHHALIRESLYQPLTASRRASLHRHVAEAIEVACRGRISSYYEQLAHHYEQAAVAEKAVEYLLYSADKARGAYLNAEARILFERARAWIERAPTAGEANWRAASHLRIHEGVADILLLAGHHDEGQEQLAHAGRFAGESWLIAARLQRKLAVSLITLRRYGEATAAFDAAETSLQRADQLDNDWWHEWAQVQIERIWAHYWQGNVKEMDAIIARAGGDIREHATQLQLGKFYQALTAVAFRRERYWLSNETRDLSDAALEAVERSGDTNELAFTHFMRGFTALWMDEFPTAAKHFEQALNQAKQIGDVTVQSRVLTYQAILRRKLGDIEGAQACIDRVLPLATQGQMLEYVGTANANLAWIAWRQGRLDDAQRLAMLALETWTGLSIVYAFRWTALLPLLAAARTQGSSTDAREHAEAMLEPSQQRLSDELTDSLEAAVAAEVDQTVQLSCLNDIVQIASQHGYL